VIGPGLPADLLAAVMLAVAAYALGRLAVAAHAGRPSERDVDAFHVAMGISMAAMLTGRLSTFGAEAWAVVFACGTVWFALRLPWHDAVRAAEVQPVGHRLAHMVSSGAMVYMLLAMPGGSMAAMGAGAAGAARLSGLAAVLALAMVVAAAAHADRAFLHDRRRAPSPAPVVVAVGAGAGEAPGGRGLPSGAGAGGPARAGWFLAPRTAATAEVVMGLAMAAMLAVMAWR
jgi:hypothetical protein